MFNLCCICESTIYPGHGSLLIKNDMRSLWFCRSKCKKAFNKKKNPLYLKWTRIFRKRKKISLDDKIFFPLIMHNKFKEYDVYLISHILYQSERLRKRKINRFLDFSFLKMK